MMIHSSSETTSNSPTPISPFSTYSRLSEATSDEAPDLGAFNTVFRELQQLQIGPPRILHATFTGPGMDVEVVSASSPGPTDSEANAGSTVWTQGLIASYFDPSVASAQTRSAVDDRSRVSVTDIEYGYDDDDDAGVEGEAEAEARVHQAGGGDEDGEDSETEGEMEGGVAFTVVGSVTSDARVAIGGGAVDDGEHPTLGTIDSVIAFLTSERDRVQAGRLAERRMVPQYSSTSDGGARRREEADARRARKRRRKKPLKTVQISRRDGPSDAPETVSETTVVRGEDASGDADRDDGIAEGDSLSSSSVEGGHEYKSTPSTPPRTSRVLMRREVRLKHSKSTPTLKVKTIPPDPQILKLRCLAHKLRLRFPEDYERITALLTQDFSGGESDFSDPRGPAPRARDRLIHVFVDHSNILIGLLTHYKKYRRPKRLSHAALALLLERGRPVTRRILVTSSPLYQPMETAMQLGYDVRIYARVPDSRRPVRYREQGVDELLQLKLHQAIAASDPPPPNATIVLATGDGNVGEFNEEGFLGPVRLALERGWKIELYAWEEGLSRAWKRTFNSDGRWKDRFRIVKMEDFADDLLQAQ